jgi:translation elongation factor EF-G
MTGGQGSYGIEFLRYDIVPGNVQQEIIKSATLADDEE